MSVNEVNFSAKLYRKLVVTGHRYFVILFEQGLHKVYAFKNLAEAMVLIKNSTEAQYFIEGDPKLEEIASGKALAPLVYLHFQ